MEKTNFFFDTITNFINENKILSIALLISTFYSVYLGFFSKNAKTKKKFKSNRPKPIFNFKNGDLGKIIGMVENIKEPYVSPLTNKKCVYYHVKVYDTSDRHESVLIDEEMTSDFILKNNSGKALIRLFPKDKDCIYEVNQDVYLNSDWLKNPTPIMEKFMKSHHKKTKNFLGLNKSLRFEEKSLEVGEKIGVLGKGYWELPIKRFTEQEFDWHKTKILTFKSLEQCSLFISDNPKTLSNRS